MDSMRTMHRIEDGRMMGEHVISIIIGIYNGEKHLPECIRSAIEQDYKNIKIILNPVGNSL